MIRLMTLYASLFDLVCFTPRPTDLPPVTRRTQPLQRRNIGRPPLRARAPRR